jgi:hypothetical protein
VGQRGEQVHPPAGTVPGAAQGLAVNGHRLGLLVGQQRQPVADHPVEPVWIKLLQRTPHGRLLWYQAPVGPGPTRRAEPGQRLL